MLLTAIFLLAYAAIVFEHQLSLNKSATALLAGVLCWTGLVAGGDPQAVAAALEHRLPELTGILFFLLGAMTIVELVDAHDGFELVTQRIRTRSRRKLLGIIAALAFVLSAVLDNLTTSIVMMTLVRKLVTGDRDRMHYGGIVIVAANAGGAFSPIGDVTTTMLWVGGQLSVLVMLKKLILPALASVVVPTIWIGARLTGSLAGAAGRDADDAAPSALDDAAPSALDANEREDSRALPPNPSSPAERAIVLATGLGVLLFVPVFTAVTHLPPFMGILLGLGVLWSLTELIHKRKNDEEKSALSVAGALQRVDTQSVLFFLGILLAIGALQSAGLLGALAASLDRALPDVGLRTLAIGLVSAVVDNVPLVAAAQGMYPLTSYPPDHRFWTLLAYCAGTGGSILVIGSAAGIAVMGIQRITFAWYVRHLMLPALLGYLAGALAFLGQEIVLAP